MLILKIYEGDRAADILKNLRSRTNLDLDEESFEKLETVIRLHTQY